MHKTFTPTYDTELIQKWYLDQEMSNVNDLFLGKKPMGNITVESISSKNLFDKNTVVVGYLNNTGTIGVAAAYRVSDFIPVVPGEKYTYQGTTIDVSYGSKIGYYNSNKQWVAYADIVSGGTTITIPNGVYYMRTTLRETELNVYQFEKGTSASTYASYQTVGLTDTGWITLTSYVNNFTSYNQNTAPRIRRIGNMIYLKGVLKPGTQIAANQSTTMFTLPTQFIPSEEYVFVCQGSTVNRWTMRILTDGKVAIERYGTTSNIDIPTTAWLPFNVVYIIA